MKIFTIILLLSSFSVFAQTSDDIAFIKKSATLSERPYYISLAQNSKGVFAKSASLLFLFYKNFISSQDMASCSFYPSCSEYALIVVRKQNLFIGTMNFFDRLTRCHTLTPQHYHINTELRLQMDPPKNARYEDL